MRTFILYFLLIFIPLQGLKAQRPKIPKPVKQYRILFDGDTLPCIDLSEYTVRGDIIPYLNKLANMQAMVLYALPYANRVAQTYRDIESHNIDSLKKRQRKKVLKEEKEKLYEDMAKVVRHMQVDDGQVFIKLVHRQCGITVFDMITRYQGSAKANMWQGLSRMGGANLKLTYQPYTEDIVMAQVLKQIEDGVIAAPSFQPYKKPEKK